MKVKEARELIEECIQAIKEVKSKDIKVVKQELYKTELTAKFCNGVSYTLRYFSGTKNVFFKVAVNLWHNIEGDLKVEYQKYLIQKIWDKLKEAEAKYIQQPQQSLSSWAKTVCNGLGTYTQPVATKRNNPVYIDTNAAYNKADIDMALDLEGFRRQQVLKQHKDDLLAASGLKEHPRLQDKDEWDEADLEEEKREAEWRRMKAIVL